MSITIIPAPDGAALRRSHLFSEHRLGQYTEFREFFRREFNLDEIGIGQPGCVRAKSGRLYLLVFIGRSGEAFPSGVEIHAVAEGAVPVEDDVADRDLWSILHWTIEGSGGEWSPQPADDTGRLYKVSAR